MSKNLLLGKILKLNRIQQGLKQDFISIKLNLTPSYYSRVENNRYALNDNQLKLAFECLEIDYTTENIDEEFEKLFYEYIEAITFLEDYKEIYNRILTYESKIKSTVSYPKYILAKLIYYAKNCLWVEGELKPYLCIEDYFEYLESYHKQLYYDYIGVYYYKNEYHKEAAEYFEKALTYRGIDMTICIVELHKSFVFRKIGRFTDSLRCIEIAKDHFINTLNIKRLVSVEYQKALVNQNMNNVEYGIKKYFQCLRALKILKMENEIHVTYNSILWSYMKDQQYDNVLKLKDEALAEIPDDPYFYFMISYTYYKLNDIHNARLYIVEAKRYIPECNDEFKVTIINALYTLLFTNDIERQELMLIKVYESALKCQDQEVEQFSLQLLCDFYREQNELDKLIKHMDLLIACHKRLE